MDNLDNCPMDVVIPQKLDGHKVVMIAKKSFNGTNKTNKLKTVDFSNAIYLEEIEDSGDEGYLAGAFAENEITRLVFGYNSVFKTIGSYAFAKNKIKSVSNLKNLTSLETLNYYSFYNNEIQEVIIDGFPRLRKIYGAFSDNKIETVIIKNNKRLTTIHKDSFSYNLITTLTIENNPKLITIAGRSFNKNLLTGDDAYIYARNSDGSEDKSTLAAYGGSKIENVSLPSNVTRLGERAFADCGIKSFASNFFDNLEYIGASALNNNRTSSSNAIIYAKNEDKTFDYSTIVSYSARATSNVIIPSTVTTIGKKAFEHTGIKGIDFSKATKLTYLGEDSFEYSNLTTLIIPASIQTIEYGAFSNTNYLTSVTVLGDSTRFNSRWNEIGLKEELMPH